MGRPQLFRGETACAARNGTFWHAFRFYSLSSSSKWHVLSLSGRGLASRVAALDAAVSRFWRRLSVHPATFHCKSLISHARSPFTCHLPLATPALYGHYTLLVTLVNIIGDLSFGRRRKSLRRKGLVLLTFVCDSRPGIALHGGFVVVNPCMARVWKFRAEHCRFRPPAALGKTFSPRTHRASGFFPHLPTFRLLAPPIDTPLRRQ